MRLATAALLVGLAAGPGAALADEGLLMRALDDELDRSMAELRIEGLERPYFIAYRVDDTELLSAAASFGSLLIGRAHRSRQLTVEVRVGGYELDNTNFLTLASLRPATGTGSGGRATLPLDDDYREIRRQAWLATDAAFKEAIEQLAQKRAVLQNKSLAEELGDFAVAEKVEILDRLPPAGGELERLQSLVVELSAIFRQQSAVFESRVSIAAGTTRTWFLNSEGTRYVTTTPSVRLLAEASTQAADGIPLSDVYTALSDSVDGLPPRARLADGVRALGARLAALRAAELVDRYNGPVLFEGQAAAELFAQAFAPMLLSRRQPLVADERLASLLSQGGPQDFRDRLGARVLPRFLSVVDDPTRSEHAGAPLLGGYRVDDQGVAAGPVALIERGYLKRMLSDRTPVAGLESSSGHARGGGVAPSNLIVSASNTMTDEELRAELLLLVEDRGADFGVIVRRLGSSGVGGQRPESLAALLGGRGGGANGVAPAIVAVKVYPDGREVPLRNLELSGFSAAAFKEIIGAGERALAYSLPFTPVSGDLLATLAGRAATGTAGPPLTTVVVPALLFEEVTLKKPSDEIPSLPVAGHPFFEAGPSG